MVTACTPAARRWIHRASLVTTAAVACVAIAACGGSSKGGSGGSGSGGSAKKHLKVFVIPKSAGNNYFTVADSVKTGGALAAIQALGDTGKVNAGSASTPSSQIPEIQSAISQGANALIVSATDATALCPTLRKALAQHIAVVTYDSDAPSCRSLFVNQASAVAIADSEIQIIAKEIHNTGQIAIVSGAASATNQNVWIADMKQYLKKYPKISLVSTVYGNDDPTTASQVVSGLLQHYPHLAGIVSPDTVGVVAAAEAVDTPQYKGKVQVTGLGTPLSMKKYVLDGSVPRFELWSPANLGYLAAYAASAIASGKLKVQSGATFSGGKLGSYKVGAANTVLLGPPLVFTKANISKYDF
jgi:rhamnose transport system substrate-binding protein